MKKYFITMAIINVALLTYGYLSMIKPYQKELTVKAMAIESLHTIMLDQETKYLKAIDALSSEKDAVTELLVQSQRDLDLMYTFSKAGFIGTDIDTIRELSDLASNLPFGSPFRDGHIITDKFGVRDERWFNGNGVHEGIDIVSRGSWEIIATADGYISDFGYNDTYGKYIEYITDGGYRLIYGHLSKIYWQEGTKVRDIPLTKGTRIGRMGNTGLTSGPHLHLEVHIKNNDGEWVKLDPEAIINYIGG